MDMDRDDGLDNTEPLLETVGMEGARPAGLAAGGCRRTLPQPALTLAALLRADDVNMAQIQEMPAEVLKAPDDPLTGFYEVSKRQVADRPIAVLSPGADTRALVRPAVENRELQPDSRA